MSSPDISRRLFLRGKVNTVSYATVIRPPWSVDQQQFLNQCSRCDDCISACPENIIIHGDGGFPEVNFKLGECTFCTHCAEACQSDAIKLDTTHPEKMNPWQLDVSVGSKCLSLNAVVCRACGDNCEPQAIRFQMKLGGISEPHISLEDCTGCGACLHVCPVDAIQIKPQESIAA